MLKGAETKGKNQARIRKRFENQHSILNRQINPNGMTGQGQKIVWSLCNYHHCHLYPAIAKEKKKPPRKPNSEELQHAKQIVDNFHSFHHSTVIILDKSNNNDIIAIIEFTPLEELSLKEREDINFVTTFLHQSKKYVNPVGPARAWGGKMWAIGWRKSMKALKLLGLYLKLPAIRRSPREYCKLVLQTPRVSRILGGMFRTLAQIPFLSNQQIMRDNKIPSFASPEFAMPLTEFDCSPHITFTTNSFYNAPHFDKGDLLTYAFALFVPTRSKDGTLIDLSDPYNVSGGRFVFPDYNFYIDFKQKGIVKMIWAANCYKHCTLPTVETKAYTRMAMSLQINKKTATTSRDIHTVSSYRPLGCPTHHSSATLAASKQKLPSLTTSLTDLLRQYNLLAAGNPLSSGSSLLSITSPVLYDSAATLWRDSRFGSSSSHLQSEFNLQLSLDKHVLGLVPSHSLLSSYFPPGVFSTNFLPRTSRMNEELRSILSDKSALGENLAALHCQPCALRLGCSSSSHLRLDMNLQLSLDKHLLGLVPSHSLLSSYFCPGVFSTNFLPRTSRMNEELRSILSNLGKNEDTDDAGNVRTLKYLGLNADSPTVPHQPQSAFVGSSFYHLLKAGYPQPNTMGSSANPSLSALANQISNRLLAPINTPRANTLGGASLLAGISGYSSPMAFSAAAAAAAVQPSHCDRHSPWEVSFGIFAASDISRCEEIILPSEWDDQHLVHRLPRSLSHSTAFEAQQQRTPSWPATCIQFLPLSMSDLRLLSCKLAAATLTFLGLMTGQPMIPDNPDVSPDSEALEFTSISSLKETQLQLALLALHLYAEQPIPQPVKEEVTKKKKK
ncbi:hypothetical protein PCANC_26095 [Puccinia coronata f. sp. avenae]|uniref:Tet-like 2OG-Fe(II) oxygenase domain-containing protein n=1 Tax=Puccinia coronata f. sp. avenae TaxID=200324 RepID=A0A2N5RYN4_9BASI|nr:hypothetical protein PCANC_26095 [Puccinia coronata f. sp. avenae]